MKRSKRQSADCHDSDDERDTPAPKSSNRVVVYRWRWDSDSESESETRNDSRYFWQQPGWRDEEWQQEDGTWMAQDSRPCSFELLVCVAWNIKIRCIAGCIMEYDLFPFVTCAEHMA
eukprot:TRINITY_DN11354_c0_g1_i4.p3 TRINITY_DN11354_c0_g1~~TRINITY_DN11354_c0_g1_i4.p3  ORF type:complete len:117 (+),score=8.01 TRINITY_DN11354_c0_g1_i4:75-425(+)